jgi:MFS family permease
MWLYKDIRNVMFAHLLLQMFFTWAVSYVPLYMATQIGFNWEQIGYITAVGLFAYVIFEWPIGYIADKWTGEKEIMAAGFLVLAVSSSWLAFMSEANLVAWMVLIFTTRLGASMIEATTESYLFKHTDGSDANTIGFFRLLRPLASVFGALLGSAALLYLPFNLIFIVLGFMMLPGLYFSAALRDTK